MNTSSIGKLLSLGAASALIVACSASPRSGEDSTGEPIGSASAADTSCTAFMQPAVRTTFQNSFPACTENIFHPNTPSPSSYGTSACEYFGVEFDGTSQVPGGTFIASAGALGVSELECGTLTANLVVYGFEDSVHGTSGWVEVASASAVGSWNGSACVLSNGGTEVTFSDAVPNPAPGVLPRYQDLMVFAQAHAFTRRFNERVWVEIPVDIGLGTPGCP
jgi:hypothetical protein